MTRKCPYCASLHSAFNNENYCSKQGDVLKETKTNAFLLRAKQLTSGEHYSRWTIRAVLDGYQLYHKKQSDHYLKPDNYLLIEEGASYSSEILSDAEVEAMIVAFQPSFIAKATMGMLNSDAYLLDHPGDGEADTTVFWSTLYPRTTKVDQLLWDLKAGITERQANPLFYEELFHELFLSIVDNHLQKEEMIHRISAKKKATKQELFYRLRIAKDYLEAHLKDKVSLDDISRVSYLSPYHFLRLFRQIYRQTPFQYLTDQRIKRAQYLLRTTSYPIQEVAEQVGYDDQGAFARAFKRFTRQAPSTYRVNNGVKTSTQNRK
ncbi:MAG: AraC family transcriptional regulator [Bacteroidota bacterium]